MVQTDNAKRTSLHRRVNKVQAMPEQMFSFIKRKQRETKLTKKKHDYQKKLVVFRYEYEVLLRVE
jgi:hypothetical protein